MLRICLGAHLIPYGKTGDDINYQTNELPREEGNITSKLIKIRKTGIKVSK